jgi:hypothetical protein
MPSETLNPPSNSKHFVGFEVFTAASMKMGVFWVVTPYSLVKVYQRFRGTCCLHHQGDDGLDDGGGNYL